MTPDAAAPEPAPPILAGRFTDPEAMAQALRGVSPATAGPYPAIVAGRPFEGELAVGMLHRLGIAVGRFAQAIPQSAGIAGQHTFMMATEPGLTRRVSGWRLGEGQIFHFRPSEQTVASSPHGQPWAFGIIAVPFDRMAAERAALGALASLPLDDDRMFQAPRAPQQRLLALLQDFARLAREAPWVLAAPAPARALSGSLLEALLACLDQGQLRRDRAALRRHRQIVARLDQALRDRPEEMLSLGDLCRAAGVAPRTLGLACQEFLGMGPVQHARGRRLDLVRQHLLAADPARSQVTGVAMRFGFWELGRFAAAYRARFGERPSATLQRAGHAEAIVLPAASCQDCIVARRSGS
ncbi:helix-turn-helix domain-containing protein [Roseomonas sp. 18066]|uniref:AraC family transcriptional regulator n=1 Tax=Roseomonas sp. 18066 TaxID=2681412 RepID=UPI001359B766|nr:helix-turn-helix domain-containing protein [Roseomonas sp. 18066]